MKGLLDLDMVAHEMGHLKKDTGEKDEDGNPIMELFDVAEVYPIAKGRVLSIIMGAEIGGWSGFLTRGRHYRHKLATILPYKGHREHAARDNVDELKQILSDDLGGIWCDRNEADDAMSIIQWQDIASVGSELGWDDATLRKHTGTVIASRDKDLDTVPGHHFKWWLKGGKDRDGEIVPEDRRSIEKGEVYWVTWIQALRNFYTQCLIGDAADNIPGLYNIGPKSAWVKQLQELDDEQDMYDHVQEKYIKYYHGFGNKFLNEVANLLHMQRREGDRWEPPCERDEHYWYL
jgi:hypothetical protein